MLNSQAVPPDSGVIIDHKSQAACYSYYLSSELMQSQAEMTWIRNYTIITRLQKLKQ